MYFLKNERFREKLRRQHLERYINFSIFLSICSLIIIGFMLFFAITSQFSEQKTVFYFLVVLFSFMFIGFVVTASYFNSRLKNQDDTQRLRANNLSTLMIRNISQQSINNDFEQRYEYDQPLQMQILNPNASKIKTNRMDRNFSNHPSNISNNRQFTRY